MSSKASKTKFWAALIIFSLVGQIAWVVENMYFNVFIYKMFGASSEAISAMVAASAIMATVTTLFIGALSDRVGKRKVFISAGYIVWGISILSFSLIRMDIISKLFPLASAAAVGVSLVIIMDCVMTFFGSSANDAAFNAWLTESTNSKNRGAAEGINAMMPLVAILAVFGGFMAFDLDKADSWTLIFIIIGAVVTIIGIVGIFIIEDTNSCPKGTKNSVFYGFKPSVIKNNKLLYITLIAFAVFSISIQVFMPYLILYYEVSLGMKDYVLIMAPAIIVASVFTAIYGRVYDKFGFKKAVIPSIALLMMGYVFLFFYKSTAPVFIGSLLMMCGYLSGAAVFGAMIRDCTPKDKAGVFQGVRIFGQVLIPGVIGPYIGSLVLRNAATVTNSDGTVLFIPNENIYLAAFIVAVLLIGVLVFEFKALNKKETLGVYNEN